MSSLPPALDFAAMEQDIVSKWQKEESFATQDRLSLERGDKVRALAALWKKGKCPLAL